MGDSEAKYNVSTGKYEIHQNGICIGKPLSESWDNLYPGKSLGDLHESYDPSSGWVVLKDGEGNLVGKVRNLMK